MAIFIKYIDADVSIWIFKLINRARKSNEYDESEQDTTEITSSVIQDTNDDDDEDESDSTANYSTPTAVCADEFDQLDAQELKVSIYFRSLDIKENSRRN